jgi:hypothetical protein
VPIRGPLHDSIRRDPSYGYTHRIDHILEFDLPFNALYMVDAAPDPPADPTYVLWNNAGILMFGGVSLGLWVDDGTYLHPVTDGLGVSLYNAGGTESGTFVRDDDHLIINSGAGGHFKLQVNGTDYIVSTANLVNIQNSSLKQMDSETYPLLLENNAGDETSELYRNDDYFIINANTGALGTKILDSASYPLYFENDAGTETGYIYRDDDYLYVYAGVAAVGLKIDNTVYGPSPTYIISTADMTFEVGDALGVNKFIFNDFASVALVTIDSDGEINIIDVATSEFGRVWRDADYLYINAGVGALGAWIDGVADIFLQVGSDDGTNMVSYRNNSGVEVLNIDGLGVINGPGTDIELDASQAIKLYTGGDAHDIEFYSDVDQFARLDVDAGGHGRLTLISDSNEEGTIWRTDTSLYLNSGAGGKIAIQHQGVTYIGTDTNLVVIVNSSLKQIDSASFPLLLENDAGSETAQLFRDDDYLYVYAHTGGLGIVTDVGMAVGYSAWETGPAGRTILDVDNRRGLSAEGGRIEQGCNNFYDHFHARRFKPQWATRVETGLYGAPATDINGWVRFTTGAGAGNEQSKTWKDAAGGDVYDYQSENRPTLQVEIYPVQIDADTNIFIGLVDNNVGAVYDGTAGSLVGFLMSTNGTGDNNWHLQCSQDNVGTRNAGEAAGVARVILRFEYKSDTEVEWFIDGASQGSVATNVPAGKVLRPVISILTDGGAKSLDVGDFETWQDVS